MARSSLPHAMLRSPRGLGGLVLTVIVVGMALLAPVISPLPPDQQDLYQRLKPPAWEAGGSLQFPLGTDQLGRDLFSRIAYGSRISLAISSITVILTSGMGLFLGLVAGYYGGRFDYLIMRLVDILLAFPTLIIAIILMTVIQPSVESVILVLTISGWTPLARMVRGQVLSLREREFVESARAVGCKPARIIFRHVMPNTVAIAIVISTIQMARFILSESALSFLGLGILPPTASWGSIINEGRDYIWRAWWIETFPGIAIITAITGISLLGDWLRDYLDPHLRT